jgi:hypothetical protein
VPARDDVGELLDPFEEPDEHRLLARGVDVGESLQARIIARRHTRKIRADLPRADDRTIGRGTCLERPAYHPV